MLASAVENYLGEQPIRVENREEVDGRTRHIQWVATAQANPSPTLGIIVGDWAHNTRSALDYTVFELVRRDFRALQKLVDEILILIARHR